MRRCIPAGAGEKPRRVPEYRTGVQELSFDEGAFAALRLLGRTG